ncbi:hypothetical protein B0T19DRAFT_444897 [Cercophora scortea]|uniref:Phosphatidate cytidylyltransferase n=1 Tax=Cercophora scortea TaxID=314031 RepID=A0AAE0I9Q8_9PEZI|nr:hypothetical protein B0T19DRAFT_444897 [Cercophora scortea]
MTGHPAATAIIFDNLQDHPAPSSHAHAVESSHSAASPPFFTLDPISQHVAAFFRTQPDVPPTPLAPERESRKDKHICSSFWPLRFHHFQRILAGVVPLPALPPFPYNMSLPGKSAVPATPRVISPSPTPSEIDAVARESYLGPVTRSAARRRLATPLPVDEEDLDEDERPGLRRSRTRSRSPVETRKSGRLTSRTPSAVTTSSDKKPIPAALKETNGHVPEDKKAANGHLSPPTTAIYSGWSWRDFSRSPSPLGLIPIHRHWRTFVHKHEVPRKALHVSIGFFVVWLYLSGTQTYSVPPYLLGAFIPIAAVDVLRHHYAPFNRFYVKVLGAWMRESEYMGYNGVIFYLLGAWFSLYFFPKDVGVMGTLLLSWCDTAASTFGRAYGRFTPRIRRGKSLAGSAAAFLVGVGTAAWFWGWLAPTKGPFPGDETFMFTGALHLPLVLAEAVGLTAAQATISGGLALGVVSVWSGLVAAASEVVDIFGWDDNLTIPVLSSLGIWGFLKIFG